MQPKLNCLRLLGLLLGVCLTGCQPGLPQSTSALPHETYIWQRAWTPDVRQAVQEHATNFSTLLVLAAEINWNRAQPSVTRARIDYTALRQTDRPIGLCLRMSAVAGLASSETLQRVLIATSQSLLAEARSNAVTPCELQVDFDCPTAGLGRYHEWLNALQRTVHPVPVTFTALPAWLDSRSFTRLARDYPSYVLQVHALQRPSSFDQGYQLCDLAAARAAIQRAGILRVPFRVALPTYAYVLAFNSDGQLVGLKAEGPPRSWPQEIKTRELWARPDELAALVAELNQRRPPALKAITWYRFPVANDRFNWRWPTLAATMQARNPREVLRAFSRRVEAGLKEVYLANEGELDISSRLAVTVRWHGAGRVASDALGTFHVADFGPDHVRYETKSAQRVRAGEQVPVGWLRLTEDREVSCEFKQLHSGEEPSP